MLVVFRSYGASRLELSYVFVYFSIFTYVSQQECVVLSCGYGTGRREGGASLVGFKFRGADGFCVGYLRKCG